MYLKKITKEKSKGTAKLHQCSYRLCRDVFNFLAELYTSHWMSYKPIVVCSPYLVNGLEVRRPSPIITAISAILYTDAPNLHRFHFFLFHFVMFMLCRLIQLIMYGKFRTISNAHKVRCLESVRTAVHHQRILHVLGIMNACVPVPYHLVL